MRIGRRPVNEARPSCQVTAAIKPSEAAFTSSSRLLTHAEFRMRGISGLEMATKTKEGRKMPRSGLISRFMDQQIPDHLLSRLIGNSHIFFLFFPSKLVDFYQVRSHAMTDYA